MIDIDIECMKPSCESVETQVAQVCLPVKIKPFAKAGIPRVKCIKDPVIDCSGRECRGKVNGTCEFTITQKIQIEIPVEFGAEVDVGETHVECHCAKTDCAEA